MFEIFGPVAWVGPAAKVETAAKLEPAAIPRQGPQSCRKAMLVAHQEV